MQKRCFLFKPDGIGDFFLASGVIRLMAREYGEENLTLAVLPVMEPVVAGQFPKASMLLLPLKTKRIFLNLFVANCLRCFRPWLALLQTRAEVSVSLRNMRDYLQNVLFFSVRSRRRFLCTNPLLENGRPVRRWTEHGFSMLFNPVVVTYPVSVEGIPVELEAHRLLAGRALGREVSIGEVWPELQAVGKPPLESLFWVCAPFSSGAEKDFPLDRWVSLFAELHRQGRLPLLVLTGSSDQAGRLKEFYDLLVSASKELADTTRVIMPENLQSFIDLLSGAECVLTVDTAAAHAATALDRRTLVLFSGKHQGMFAPWRRSARQLWLLPKPRSESLPWYSCHETGEIMKHLDAVLSA